MSKQKPIEVADTLENLLLARGGDLGDQWPYACTFPDGTTRVVLGVSPKDAAEKVLAARRCSQKEVVDAALAAMKRDRDSLFLEKAEADDAA